MVKKKNIGVWEKSYMLYGGKNKGRYVPEYINNLGRLKHYKYIDPDTKEKQSIYVYMGVFSTGASGKEWFFRVASVAKNGSYIGTLDSQVLGITFKTAEQAKATALKSYKKWLLNLPGVIYVK
jgi:hypothetical protein